MIVLNAVTASLSILPTDLDRFEWTIRFQKKDAVYFSLVMCYDDHTNQENDMPALTVSQLIETLQKLPQDLPVVIEDRYSVCSECNPDGVSYYNRLMTAPVVDESCSLEGPGRPRTKCVVI